jgi:hypothetical protein
MENSNDIIFANFESAGEEQVRTFLALGSVYNAQTSRLAKEWLSRIEKVRESAVSARRDEREEETLALAKKANDIALRALELANNANSIAKSNEQHAATQAQAALRSARYSMYAALIAVVALIISVKEYFS